MPLSTIEQLLKERMGLHSATVGSATVAQAVEQRMRACGIDEAGAYAQIVSHSDTEMDALIDTVVIPETWFFRDRNPFDAFRHWIETEWLPHNALQPLRILSVPCSSGEEPYTLAMCLADAGLPASAGHIDAVDIGSTNIEKANQAIYGTNSFRGSDLVFRDRYFATSDGGYQLIEDIRNRVKFSQANILDAGFSSNRQTYHIIFCRNLLIYFDRPTQEHAIDCLDGMLDTRGLLFLGHSETSLLLNRDFEPLEYNRSFGFRRSIGKPVDRQPETVRRQAPKPQKRNYDTPASRQVKPFQDVNSASTNSGRDTTVQPDENMLKTANRLADQGHLDEAAQYCETLLSRQVHQAGAYYLLGVIRQAAGNLPEAEKLYRKSIYLQPDHYQALTQLAALCQQKGDTESARRLSRRATRAHDRCVVQETDS
jgi:chemotaxis protein methyltransferase WspC